MRRSAVTSMDYAEGADDALTVRRQQIADDGQRAVAGAALRFDERLRCRAHARAAHGIANQAEDRLFELGARAHLDGRAVVEKRLGDLAEVLHVRPEDDRFAVERRLEDVVSASGNEAAADEHDGRNLIELRELAN